jgi:hypothetical protein
MSKDEKYSNTEKIRFVKDMLELGINKKMDSATKDKLFQLIGKEVEKIGYSEESLLERLQKVEEFVSSYSEPVTTEGKPYGKESRHLPAQTKAFLNLFNNSKGLKFLTHKFNSGKIPYDDFIETCRIEFSNAKDEYKHIPATIIERVENFAFSETPEWNIVIDDKKTIINKGWSEPSFIEWYNNEMNAHPGLDAKWNTEMIIPFKNSIEVKAGNFLKILINSLATGLEKSVDIFKININKASINTAEFYTDVNNLQRALIHIFSVIKEYALMNFCFEINIDFVNETLNGGTFKKIHITHVGSEPTKLSNDKDFAKGDLISIRNLLWGLCNYEIIAKFPDGYKRRILLTDNLKEYNEYSRPGNPIDMEHEKDTITGFTHILKFY